MVEELQVELQNPPLEHDDFQHQKLGLTEEILLDEKPWRLGNQEGTLLVVEEGVSLRLHLLVDSDQDPLEVPVQLDFKHGDLLLFEDDFLGEEVLRIIPLLDIEQHLGHIGLNVGERIDHGEQACLSALQFEVDSREDSVLSLEDLGVLLDGRLDSHLVDFDGVLGRKIFLEFETRGKVVCLEKLPIAGLDFDPVARLEFSHGVVLNGGPFFSTRFHLFRINF